MHYLEWIFRHMARHFKEYILTVETLVSIFTAILLYHVFAHASQLWSVVGRVGSFIPGPWRADTDMQRGLGAIHRDRTKASWELKKEHVAVFAIQGRRPHMEDRFNIVTELDHTDASIYGVFDGHGGEVNIEKSKFIKECVRICQILTLLMLLEVNIMIRL